MATAANPTRDDFAKMLDEQLPIRGGVATLDFADTDRIDTYHINASLHLAIPLSVTAHQGGARHVVEDVAIVDLCDEEQAIEALRAQSGGILPGIGVHSLDVLLWWLGERATSVYAVVQNIDPHPDIDIEDEASLVATSRSGAVINAALSFHHQAGTDWVAAGSDGVIQLSSNSGRLLLNGKEQGVPEVVEMPGELHIQREFLTAIRDQRPLAQASGEDVRQVMALIFAAQESGRSGRAVAVPE